MAYSDRNFVVNAVMNNKPNKYAQNALDRLPFVAIALIAAAKIYQGWLPDREWKPVQTWRPEVLATLCKVGYPQDFYLHDREGIIQLTKEIELSRHPVINDLATNHVHRDIVLHKYHDGIEILDIIMIAHYDVHYDIDNIKRIFDRRFPGSEYLQVDGILHRLILDLADPTHYVFQRWQQGHQYYQINREPLRFRCFLDCYGPRAINDMIAGFLYFGRTPEQVYHHLKEVYCDKKARRACFTPFDITRYYDYLVRENHPLLQAWRTAPRDSVDRARAAWRR